MSENFPFDTVDEFLATYGPTPKKAKRMTDTEDNQLAITIPRDMPDKTPIQQQARLVSVAILGIAAFTQDRYVLLAAVAGAALVECVRMWGDVQLRGYRNARVEAENVAAIEAHAHVKGILADNG